MKVGPEQAMLLEPFPQRLVKRVEKGRQGSADYVSWTDKAQRLIQVLGWFDWDAEVIPGEWDVRDVQGKAVTVAVKGGGEGREPVVVRGVLTVEVDDRLRKITGIGTGSDAKKAETDSFARACGKLGVGLHLWCGGGEKDGGYWIAQAVEAESTAMPFAGK